MHRSTTFYTILLCCLLLFASLGGAFATWRYSDQYASNVESTMHPTLSDFEWKPEQILPTESELGKNHLALIELILNESNKGYGLNYDNKHVLESYLNSNGIIFSNQKTSGGNLKFVSDETDQLYYCVEKVNDTTYYAYTFAYSELNSVKGTEKYMPVYRTTLEKTDKWRAPRSFFGYAKTALLRAFGASAMSGQLSYTINVDTWIHDVEYSG